MSPCDDRTDLVATYQQARDGDQNAAKYIYDFFYPRFKIIVRRHLAKRVRSIVDDDDVIQDAWLSLLKAPKVTFASPRQLAKYLQTTLKHHVLETNRKYLKFERHSLNREKHLERSPEPAPKPQYEELEISDLRWEKLLADVTPGQRAVLLLLRQGKTYDAIGEQTGLNPANLRRIFRRVISKHVPA